MHDAHDHGDHDHHAPPQPDHDRGPATPYEVLATALAELMVEKGVVGPEEIRAQMEVIDTRSPALGARVVARAWTDDGYRERLLSGTREALAEMGVDIGSLAEYRVVENTPEVHNVVVCTLCSCYPKMLLGIPPAWYKSLAYRSRTVRDPRGVLAEFGTHIAEGTEVRVHDSTAEIRCFVLPLRPPGTEGWSPERLEGLVTRDCLIGTAVPALPGPGANLTT
ncbi:MAG: nitrile hydratase subunit alpha [Rhizobiales bacterium]|nr:nitrile hydratase subunit alpha [Hyphomicrobiales bacterium]